MKKSILITIISLLGFSCQARGLEGSWQGNLEINTARLPLVFNFSGDGDDLLCTLDSPMQGAKGIPGEVKYCSADSVVVEFNSIGAQFSGHCSSESITGIFNQMGARLPLTLVRKEAMADNRPQTPHPPYPYQSVDTTFTSEDGTVLAATLTFPSDRSGAFPAVIMVSGSGPQNRDEEIAGHKPFAVIADYLARNGIASLRYDDRGTAKSGGNFATSDFDTFCADARAALAALRSVNGVGNVGVIGHSEGGAVALKLASESLPDFVVTLAAPVQQGRDIIIEQNRHSFELNGIKGQEQADCIALVSSLLDDFIAGKQPTTEIIAKRIADNKWNIPATVMPSVERVLHRCPHPITEKCSRQHPCSGSTK